MFETLRRGSRKGRPAKWYALHHRGLSQKHWQRINKILQQACQGGLQSGQYRYQGKGAVPDLPKFPVNPERMFCRQDFVQKSGVFWANILAVLQQIFVLFVCLKDRFFYHAEYLNFVSVEKQWELFLRNIQQAENGAHFARKVQCQVHCLCPRLWD